MKAPAINLDLGAGAASVAERQAEGHSAVISYPRFLSYAIRGAFEGDWRYCVWMILLTSIFLTGLYAWGEQVRQGMILTNMSNHVSWGIYIANFTFLVGLAAGGVMMVIPAYLYRNDDMHRVVIVGELLAIASIVMCIAFVVVDLGRPDRFWHMMPGLGKFNWPVSMLTWDVIVLNGYLLLNLHICGYLLYMRYLGRKPNPRWYVPFIYLSIVWAVSIHTVTAFLYSGLGGRPFWNTSLLAPRFLASAFIAGPAFLIVTLLLLRRWGAVAAGGEAVRLLANIMRVTLVINLIMLVSEVFTEFYTGSSHAASAVYLFFGLHGANALVPWIWTAVAMNVAATLIILCPKAPEHTGLLVTACVLSFVGIWIEKGMGLIIPGFIPSTLHEVVEYLPSLVEWKISAGIWALGLMIFTVALKIALPVLSGSARLPQSGSKK
jgi:Ni/Fe-hydrogenase subunit HybB-like protein